MCFVTVPGGPGKTAPQGKRAMPPVLFYGLVVIMAAVAVLSCLNMFSSRSGKGKAAGAEKDAGDAPLTLYFEKTDVRPDNVFRFSLLLENGRAVFQVDDIRSRRHPEALVVTDPPGLDVLRGRIGQSGIWKVRAGDVGRDGSGLRRRLGIILGSKTADLVVDGRRAEPEFEDVENAVYEFAEGCGMQTVSMSGEEILRMAEDNFNKAEDLYANRESDGANLRDAISRYRVVVNYLGQFAPPPRHVETGPGAPRGGREIADGQAGGAGVRAGPSSECPRFRRPAPGVHADHGADGTRDEGIQRGAQASAYPGCET